MSQNYLQICRNVASDEWFGPIAHSMLYIHMLSKKSSERF